MWINIFEPKMEKVDEYRLKVKTGRGKGEDGTSAYAFKSDYVEYCMFVSVHHAQRHLKWSQMVI